jgi:lipoprotein-anchoring transpeptidase ErfK/SrfK
MKGCTNYPCYRALSSMSACAVLFIFGINILAVSATAAPAPVITKSTAQTKTTQEDITWTIQTLKKSQARWIEVNLKKQQLIAWEGDNAVFKATVSSGKSRTPTLKGVFNVQTKLRESRMRGPGYDIPDVPYTMYYDGGYAIHGAYWHSNFGTPVSHGCINLRPKQARWLFDWAKVGTTIVIR